MSDFKIIKDVKEINFDKRWVDKPFRKTYVNERGKSIILPNSDKYEIIAVKERKFTRIERFKRGFLGTLLLICTLGTVWFLPNNVIRKLFEKKSMRIKYGRLKSNLPDDIKYTIKKAHLIYKETMAAINYHNKIQGAMRLNKCDIIDKLPHAISFSIFSKLDDKSLKNCFFVSKNWNKLAHGKDVWSKITANPNHLKFLTEILKHGKQ